MVDQIGNEQAQGLISGMASRVRRQTVVNVISTLSGILQTANDWGYSSRQLNWKRLTLPQRPERTKRAFFRAEQARAIIELSEKKYPGQPWATFFALAAMTGMRAGELVTLKLTDLDFEHGLVGVRRSAWLGRVGAVEVIGWRARAAHAIVFSGTIALLHHNTEAE